MNHALLAPSSYWNRGGTAGGRFPTLEGVHKTQIAVVGAGITGLSTALELLQRGYQVTVCEASVIGAGTTAGSTGHLDAVPEQGARKLIKDVGLEDARQVVDLRLKAIDAIEQRSDANCDFVRIPTYQYSERRRDEESLRDDCDAAADLGLAATWSNSIPLEHAACGFTIQGMARFHCGRYLERLADLVVDAGGKIFEHTKVQCPTEKHEPELSAGGGRIEFEQAVIAVHSGYTASLRVYMMIPPYQSYVLAARLGNRLPDALYWDNDQPYHYIRRASSSAEDIYLIGGCDHHTGAGDERQAVADLEQYARSRFDVREIICSWSAEFFEPTDGLPLIGRDATSENVWLATGFSGVGLTWGTAAARLIAAQIHGSKTPLEERLSPRRFGSKHPATMAMEQLPGVADYAERVLPADEVDPDSLAAGEGCVGMIDGVHTAVCRTADGRLHRRSPICTHMGGVVRWNPVEQTWDCPVHGGRFDAEGCRLYGPPESDLETP
ncbi:FAD-dependent oxidoreductase [Candidatus Laterigemmans baculatus]|uniref:FAD-dependent oxidoreductase n=1 Tax=Candidatus Laterigemmans baculatus TaxID=2770505 RepID=UPI0013DC9CC1|nr:FAD-dependent oxidoreductase [Candidatus Laterigemmans baculatus]